MRKQTVLAAFGLALATAGSAFAQDTIYGIDNSRNVLGTFTAGDPGTFTDIGPTGIGTGFTNSLEFDAAGDLWASDGTQLFSVDVNTGAATLVGSHGNLSGETLSDFTWDGSTMWAIGTQCGVKSSLWTVDLGTGAATFVCQTDISGACDVGLTLGADGVLYGHDLVSDTIYSVDPDTCETSTVINIAFDTNFGQGLTASDSTNYHVAFNNNAFAGELYSFDGSGNHTILGTLEPLQIAAADVEPAADCLSMTVSDLVAGEDGIWEIGGAAPGAEVSIVYGFEAGSTVVRGRFAYCAEFGIVGVTRERVVCRGIADNDGNLSCVAGVPMDAQGVLIYSQAAERGTCPNTCMSRVDSRVVK